METIHQTNPGQSSYFESLLKDVSRSNLYNKCSSIYDQVASCISHQWQQASSTISNFYTRNVTNNKSAESALKHMHSVAIKIYQVFMTHGSKKECASELGNGPQTDSNTTIDQSAENLAESKLEDLFIYSYAKENINSQLIEKTLSAISRKHCLGFLDLPVTTLAGVAKVVYGVAQVLFGIGNTISCLFSGYNKEKFNFGLSRVVHGIGNVFVGLAETNPVTIGALLIARTVVTRFYHPSLNPENEPVSDKSENRFHRAFAILYKEAKFMDPFKANERAYISEITDENGLNELLENGSTPLLRYSTFDLRFVGIKSNNLAYYDSPSELLHFCSVSKEISPYNEIVFHITSQGNLELFSEARSSSESENEDEYDSSLFNSGEDNEDNEDDKGSGSSVKNPVSSPHWVNSFQNKKYNEEKDDDSELRSPSPIPFPEEVDLEDE